MKKDKLTLKTKILREIFELAPNRYREENLESHIFLKKFNISKEELKNNIDFLVEIGLIQRFPGKTYKEDRIFEWLITEKGLDYLEKISQENKQISLQSTIIFLTLMIGITEAFTFFSDLELIKPFTLFISYILGTILIAYFSVFLIFKRFLR